MEENDTVALDRAAKAQKALDRAEDGAKAMAEYVADREAVDVNTARLRELRLAKEHAERKAAAAATKPKKSSRKTRSSEPA